MSEPKAGTATGDASIGRRPHRADEALMLGANSVELKVTVPVAAHRATIQGLPLDPVEAQPRQVFFFDTPDLALYNAGVVVRARRIQGGRATRS